MLRIFFDCTIRVFKVKDGWQGQEEMENYRAHWSLFDDIGRSNSNIKKGVRLVVTLCLLRQLKYLIKYFAKTK